MTSTSSTKQSTSILVTLVCTVSILLAIPTISTIVSIPRMQIISTKIVETKLQPSTKFFSKGKEKEEEIDLDEEIVIPNWDISNLYPDQMQIFGELLQKKAK